MNWITANLFWFKLVGVAIVIAAIFGSGVYVTKDHYEAIIAKKQVETDTLMQKQQAENIKILADNVALTKAAEEQHATNQLVVNDLTQRIADLSRVRIHIPNSRPVCTGGETSAGKDPTSGVLSDRVDELFADLQARTGKLIQQCDQINIDAIELNAKVK
jgi:hypothetical protein